LQSRSAPFLPTSENQTGQIPDEVLKDQDIPSRRNRSGLYKVEQTPSEESVDAGWRVL